MAPVPDAAARLIGSAPEPEAFEAVSAAAVLGAVFDEQTAFRARLFANS